MRMVSCCLGLLFSLSLSAQDFTLLTKEIFKGKKGELIPYRMLLPENYDPNTKYPLVLFLHGAGERGDDNEKQLVHGVKAFLKAENRANFPCIVIAPQCPVDSYWASAKFERTKYPIDFDFNYDYPITKGLDLAIQLTRSIIKTKSVDKKRVYITGLSMGGMGTFEAVYRKPSLFAAAVAVCGGADVDAYKKKHAKKPFWIFHGDVDGVVEVKNSRAMNDKLKSLGADVKYTEYVGINHNSWEKAYEEAELLPWLFTKKR